MENGVCVTCGIPTDAEVFDDSQIVEFPGRGERVVLATFQLPAQYCGVLVNFAQFTDLHAIQNERIDTPGLEWIILRNGQPLFPYLKFEHIVNPWGYNNYPIAVRLDENVKLEFIVRNREYDDNEGRIEKIGGRICGRYWYNSAYGGYGKAGGCEVLEPGGGDFL